MMSTVLLLKILHCNKKGQRTKCKTDKKICIPKKEAVNNENKCRVCLKAGDLPIYGADNNENDLAEALSTIGGIEIHKDDDLPKELCQSCHSLLQGAILLRKTAQESDLLLKSSDDSLYKNSNNEEFEYLDENNDDAHEIIKFECKKCEMEFPSYEECRKHKNSAEHVNKRFTCPVCNKSYTPLYYKSHLKIHAADCPFVCDICGKKFLHNSMFTRHRVTHSYKLPFKCDLCPYRGRFQESIKLHMRTHTGEKPYQCSECAARFICKSNLNKHMNTHKEEHDFNCETCGRGYFTKRQLDMHIKVDHAGIRDHKCNICGKEFGYRKQMMKHQLKVHKRQKMQAGRLPLYLQAEKLGKDADTGN